MRQAEDTVTADLLPNFDLAGERPQKTWTVAYRGANLRHRKGVQGATEQEAIRNWQRELAAEARRFNMHCMIAESAVEEHHVQKDMFA